LAKVIVKMLPLIRGDGAHALEEVVLKVQKAIQKVFELMIFADVNAVSKLVK
jgi:hypothetical protein